MYLIKGIKDIKNNILNIYVIKDKIFLDLPSKYMQEDFKVLNFDKDIFVSAGWIDSHVHCNDKNQLYGSIPDDIGVKQGVTTIIDAGSVGIDNLEDLFRDSKNNLTNVKCLLNISRLGIFKQSELSDLKMINILYDKSKYKDFVIGFKARMSKSVTISSGVDALKIFNPMRKLNNLPLMVHVGNEPPKFSEIVNYLNKGDVITHIFNYKNNSLFSNEFEPTDDLKIAIKKGILFDVGHGSESYSQNCAEKTIQNNFNFDIISTDIYRRNAENGIVVSLAEVMSKIKYCGLEWGEVIEKVTKNPANIFNLKKDGQIENGFNANLTFFKIVNKKKTVKDSNKIEFEINEYIEPVGCLINGRVMKI